MTKYFTVAQTYIRKSKTDHCNPEATFISEILLQDKFKSFALRIKSNLKKVKG